MNLLGGKVPVGTASRASALKLSGESLPALWEPRGLSLLPWTPQAHPSLPAEAQGLCLPPSSVLQSASLDPFPLALPEGK